MDKRIRLVIYAARLRPGTVACEIRQPHQFPHPPAMHRQKLTRALCHHPFAAAMALSAVGVAIARTPPAHRAKPQFQTVGVVGFVVTLPAGASCADSAAADASRKREVFFSHSAT